MTGGIILALALVCGSVLLVVRLLRGGWSGEGRKDRTEESGTIQDIFQGVEKMEKRVEALETIILDK
jgi:phage shock protein B